MLPVFRYIEVVKSYFAARFSLTPPRSLTSSPIVGTESAQQPPLSSYPALPEQGLPSSPEAGPSGSVQPQQPGQHYYPPSLHLHADFMLDAPILSPAEPNPSGPISGFPSAMPPPYPMETWQGSASKSSTARAEPNVDSFSFGFPPDRKFTDKIEQELYELCKRPPPDFDEQQRKRKRRRLSSGRDHGVTGQGLVVGKETREVMQNSASQARAW